MEDFVEVAVIVIIGYAIGAVTSCGIANNTIEELKDEIEVLEASMPPEAVREEVLADTLVPYVQDLSACEQDRDFEKEMHKKYKGLAKDCMETVQVFTKTTHRCVDKVEQQREQLGADPAIVVPATQKQLADKP